MPQEIENCVPGNLPRLLTVEEALAALRIGRTALYRMMAAGKIPVVRTTPKKVMFRESDLAAFMAARPWQKSQAAT